MKVDKDKIIGMIDEMTAPNAMSQEEALEWLEDLDSDIESRIDALREGSWASHRIILRKLNGL